MSLDNTKPLPAIPAKRYFTIGEVSELCGVKAYVLRYWEQEFTQLKPMKRRGNRRYYQHHEVLLIRRIRDLLYEQGFTISGARNQLADAASSHVQAVPPSDDGPDDGLADDTTATTPMPLAAPPRDPAARTRATDSRADFTQLDDAALEAMAREDLAIIERAQRGVGEFAVTAPHVHTLASIPAGNAGVRAAALQTRRTSPTTSSTPIAAPGVAATPEQLRAELLAIRALLVG
jgi:DNA-binding transcriptional MerR regulator